MHVHIKMHANNQLQSCSISPAIKTTMDSDAVGLNMNITEDINLGTQEARRVQVPQFVKKKKTLGTWVKNNPSKYRNKF